MRTDVSPALSVSFSVWAVNDLLALDGLCDGVLRRKLTCSPRTRHSIYAAIAMGAPVTQQTAEVMRHGKARDIAALALGEVPKGLLGAFERLGSTVFPRSSYYDLLVGIFRRRNDPRRKALQHCGPISQLTLDAIVTLEERWLHHAVLRSAHDLNDVLAFRDALRALQRTPGAAPDHRVLDLIAQLQSHHRLNRVIVQLVQRASAFPAPPFAADADFDHLTTASELAAAGRAFHNCLKRKALAAVCGKYAFSIFRGKAVVEFRRLAHAERWLLADIHVDHNRHVKYDLIEEVREACIARGVDYLVGDNETHSTRGLMKMASEGGLFDFDL